MSYICNCYKDNFFDKKYSYWEDGKITNDEMDVINFISNSKKLKLNPYIILVYVILIFVKK